MSDEHDQQYDWRAELVTSLASEWVSSTTGHSHRVGAPVVGVTPGRDQGRRPLWFVSPSPEALALDLAIKSAVDADGLVDCVRVARLRADRIDLSVDDQDLPALYDYFEACFVTVVFSFAAIEAFANREIATANPKDGQEVVRRGEKVVIAPDRVERELNLGEKLDLLLPRILGVPSPKGRKPWAAFRAIQSERDALVHLKDADAHPRAVERQSIFHRFWVDGVDRHPRGSLAMIEWFYQGRAMPGWIVAAHTRL
jgi:hypothetical protein